MATADRHPSRTAVPPRYRRGGLGYEQIARLLGIKRGMVYWHEQQALSKLRRHPTIRALANEYGFAVEARS